MRFANEGRPFILFGLAILTLLAWLAAWQGGWWLAPAIGWAPVALWTPWFFRDPRRAGTRNERLVIAPADGQVVSVVEVNEPDFLKGPAKRISVFMNVFDVHVNRHPANGTVRWRQHRKGRFFNATLDKASEKNECASLGVETPRGPIMVRQIAGLIARRIVTDPEVGTTVRQGERLGIIRFGSRVDTFLPSDAVILVSVGDRTRAGVTVIAEWPT